MLQTPREVSFYLFTPIRARLDGAGTQAVSAIVSKGRLYGGRFLQTAAACAAEPGFSVMVFDNSGIGAALLYGVALPLDLLGRATGERHMRMRRIDFIGNKAVPTQADGDAAGWTTISVTDAPAAMPVVVGVGFTIIEWTFGRPSFEVKE